MLAGMSASVAVAVKVNNVCSLTTLLPIAASTGATLTSFTVTVTLLLSDNAGLPLSVATTLNVYVPAPWASVGVHVNTPVEELMVAPEGAPESE